MNKYKITIKGNEEGFSVNTRGEINRILTTITQFLCEVCIDSNISKKDFLEACKKTYELTLEHVNEEK